MKTDELVTGQRNRFLEGHTLGIDFRLDALKKLGEAIEAHEKDILTALAQDLNKSETESYLCEINLLKKDISYTRKHLRSWMKRKPVASTLPLITARCYQVAEPYGVTLIMSPWNYPILLSLQPLIASLAAGNCAVVKPSAYAPASSQLIADIIGECFPEDYCAVVQGSRRENQELLEQPFDYIFFTGSPVVGRTVMAAAAKNLTPVTLELGGKSPVIVDEAIDLELVARRFVFGKFINAGQTCVAPDHIFIPASRQDEFVEFLKKAIETAYPADPQGGIPDYPRIINEKHFDRLCGLMQGQEIVFGGETDRSRLFIRPTILKNVSLESPVMQEEIFGPIVPLIPYTDLAEVIRGIRSRPKPLALYLFSEDRELQKLIEETVSFGGGCINDTIMHLSNENLPFGGVGNSGMGQYHGRKGFDTFTHYKSIVNNSAKLDLAVRYRPYSSKTAELLKKL